MSKTYHYGDYRVEQVDAWRWRVPQQGKMNTDGLIFAGRRMMGGLLRDQAVQQVVNVASLPGIVGRSMAMPDMHDAETRADLVAELGLYLVVVDRQLLVAADLATCDVGDDLFMHRT